jgi:antitoxin VapB
VRKIVAFLNAGFILPAFPIYQRDAGDEQGVRRPSNPAYHALSFCSQTQMIEHVPLANPTRIVYTQSIYPIWPLEVHMDTAKIFQNGKSQAIRLPKEYRFRGSKVYLKRMGNAVILIPEQDSWRPLIESLDRFTPDFMEERNQPPNQPREDLFE